MLRTQTAQFFNGSLRLNLCLFFPYDILSFDCLLRRTQEWGLQHERRSDLSQRQE